VFVAVLGAGSYTFAEAILAENRKFKLFLAVCLQQLEATSRETAAAILANAANLASLLFCRTYGSSELNRQHS
jgi:hypothetical protein